MGKMNAYAPGTFCWVELATSDGPAAKQFYSELMGWECADMPIGEGSFYTMLRVGGLDVAALYGMDAAQKARGVPPHWNCYISVEDVDASTRRARELGATVMMEPFDVMEVGRMSFIQDPGGAAVALWQPKQHIGARLTGDVGSMCWHELGASDMKKCADFYTRLFGWATNQMEMGSGPYTMFMLGQQAVGGMYDLAKMAPGVPPHWMVYFTVADCDGDVERAQKMGAKVIVPPTDVPTVGRFSTLCDPQGAAFSIIKMLG